MKKLDVVVYLSSLQKQTAGRKIDTLLAFAHGARVSGASVHIEDNLRFIPAKLAVILGWPSPILSTPNIKFRAEIVNRQKDNMDHTMSIDANCFKFIDTESLYLRYSINSVEYDKGQYANKNSNNDKWLQIQRDFNLHIAPWKNSGEYNLLLIQRDGGWGMKGLNPVKWAEDKINKIRRFNNDPIMLRPHPGKISDLSHLKQKGVYISNSVSTPLLQDLQNAKRAFVFNSSSGVAAIMSGVHLWVDDSSSVCWDVANRNIDSINEPYSYDRTQWINDLSACHWTDQESKKGLIYQKFLPYLN